MDVGRDQIVLAPVLLGHHAGDDLELDVQQRRQRTEIDDVLEQPALLQVVELRQQQGGDGHADFIDVAAPEMRRQGLGVVVEQVTARLDVGDVLRVGLGIHGHHDVHALAAAEVAPLAHAHLEPGRQPLDVGGENVARRHRNAHAEQRLGKHAIGARRTRSVDVGEADDEVVVGDVHCA